jgi:hypothetical protein
MQNGFIVVNGIQASCHSDFILDDVTPARLRHLLPYVYQVAFTPITLLYNIAGPAVVEALTDRLVPLVSSNMQAFGVSLLVAAGACFAAVSNVASRSVAGVASSQL